MIHDPCQLIALPIERCSSKKFSFPTSLFGLWLDPPRFHVNQSQFDMKNGEIIPVSLVLTAVDMENGGP